MREVRDILKEAGLGGLALTGVMMAPDIKKGVKDAHTELKAPIVNTSNVDADPGKLISPPKIKKIAAFDKDKTKENAYKAMPYVVGGSVAGLALAEIAMGKNPLTVIKPGAAKGAINAFRKNKYINLGIKAVKGAVDFTGKAVKEDVKRLWAIDDEILRKAELDRMMAQNPEYAKKVEDGLKEAAKNKWNSKTGPFASFDMKDIIEEATDRVKKEYPKESLVDKALGGFAQGSAMGAGAFTLHHFGDEFFRLKDRDEVRKRLRESYVNDGKSKNNKIEYQTPKQQSESIMKNFNIDKQADFKSKAKEILVDDVLRNGKRSIIYAGTPAVAAVAMKRDVRKDFSKLNTDKTDSDRIVVEVPINTLDKKASVKSKTIDGLKKVVNKKTLEEDGRNVIKALSWTAPPTLLAAAVGKNIRGNMEDLKDNNLKPLEPGKARIIIETNGGNAYNDSDNYYGSMSKGASIDEVLDKYFENFDAGKEEEFKARKLDSLESVHLNQGQKAKEHKESMMV